MNQQALIPDGRVRIWPRFRLSGSRAINAAPWMDALSRNEPVGNCRCGAHLWPGQPYTPIGANRQWYPATCKPPAGCGHQLAAAGPAPTRRRKSR
ncbi:hypothetical protein ACIBJE_02180 [Micromonospora sp. NPDC050187]|uniref:hypothetical protein n=1 Tax=Micromonospora sp. NPDC050187 TaxID=3364277 RepID=UPI0037A6D210